MIFSGVYDSNVYIYYVKSFPAYFHLISALDFEIENAR